MECGLLVILIFVEMSSDRVGSFHFDVILVADGLLLRGVRIIIPNVLRPEMLSRIHDGYQGTSKCRERAKQGIWWPGLSSQILEIVMYCEHCQIHRNAQQHEPLIPTYILERPWQHISADLCEFKGKDFLIIMDYYSRYVEVIHMSSTTAPAIVNTMKNVFARWGIPDLVISDNGGQFDSTTFKVFAESYGFCHETSCPKFPPSNGEAERAVQIVKSILHQPDPQLALMTYRSTPVAATGHSPSELMMGRRIRTTLPVLPRQLKP